MELGRHLYSIPFTAYRTMSKPNGELPNGSSSSFIPPPSPSMPRIRRQVDFGRIEREIVEMIVGRDDRLSEKVAKSLKVLEEAYERYGLVDWRLLGCVR